MKKLAALVFCACMLGACGQSGPLYLPGEDAVMYAAPAVQ